MPMWLAVQLTQAKKPTPENMKMLLDNYDSVGLVRHLVRTHKGLADFACAMLSHFLEFFGIEALPCRT